MENKTGWFPMLHKIIVLPEETEIKSKAGTWSREKSLVYVPPEFTQRDDMVQVVGRVVACGPEVLSDKPNSKVPKPGDVVMFGKLAGSFFKGADGITYRMIQDLDLVAIKGAEENE